MTTDAIRELTTESELRRTYPVLSQLLDQYTVDEYLDRLSRMRENDYRLFASDDGGDIVGVIGAATSTTPLTSSYVIPSPTRSGRRKDSGSGCPSTFTRRLGKSRASTSLSNRDSGASRPTNSTRTSGTRSSATAFGWRLRDGHASERLATVALDVPGRVRSKTNFKTARHVNS